MNKLLVILLVGVSVFAILFFVSPYTIKTICFGDVCPDNGGTFIFYTKDYTKEECIEMGADPVTGIGFGEVYAGCSPSNFLSDLVLRFLN